MKFKVGDKIKYWDFLVERNPKLDGVFVVDRAEPGSHPGCNLISSPDLRQRTGIKLICSADFELAERHYPSHEAAADQGYYDKD